MASKIRVLIEADGRTYESTLDRSTKKTRDFGKETKNTAANVSHFSTVLKGAAGVIAALGLARLTREMVQANIELDRINNTLAVATGSAEAAKNEMAFLRAEAERLGLDLRRSAGDYARFAAATRETALEGQLTREIFLAVAEAATAVGLSAEETSGALRALEQIVSKGNVSAEELRGQLGERIPGAFRLAAKAIGVTQSELNKMLELGELTAEELLPALARELRNTFGPQAAEAADNLQQEINRLHNAFFDIMSGGDVEGLTEAIGDLADTVGDPEIQRDLRSLVSGLATLAEWAVKGGAALGELVDSMKAERMSRLRKEADDIRSRIQSLEESAARPFLLRLFGREPQEEISKLKQRLVELQTEINRLENRSEDEVAGPPSDPDETGAGDGVDEKRKKAIEAADKAIAKLEREVALMGDLTNLESLNADIRLGAYEKAEPHQIERLRALAAEADAKQKLIDLESNFRDMQEQLIEDTTSAIRLEKQRYEEELRLLREAEEAKLDSIVEYKELRERLEQRHQARLKEIAEDAAQAELEEMEKQLGDIAFAARDAFKEFEDAIIQAARTGKFEMRDMVESILADLARLAIQENVTKPLYNAVLPVLQGVFGADNGIGTTTTTTPEGYTVQVPGGHGGAVIGHDATTRHRVDPRAFDGAPRHHRGTGDLGSNEVPFVGLKGEGVFTEEQMKRLAPVGAGGAAPMEIHVHNNGAPAEVARTRQSTGPDGRRIFEIWLQEVGRDLGANGPYTRMMQGTFPSLKRGGVSR